jgi:phage terminase large subunit-like protein
MTAALEHGRLTFAEAVWNKAFFDELLRAPGGRHDDQIDSVAIAFNELSKRVGR